MSPVLNLPELAYKYHSLSVGTTELYFPTVLEAKG